ncbi:Flagellar biosynthesis protein, FliO [Candidatus Magnetomorum sp. HK-1]|nr:Flagellar biosynthesis protein, FliO [Candidatus Magnetomorum sp. HK-1]
MDLWYTASKTFAMLCVVLGVLLAFLYALKRLTQKGVVNQGQIRLISTFSIGPRKQIMLLDVMEERLVLGVTSEHINCLARYPQIKEEKQLETQMPQSKPTQENYKIFDQKNGLNQPDSENKNVSQVQSKK